MSSTTTASLSSSARVVGPRLVRGTAAGTAATFFALAFHLLADGGAPGLLALLTPLAASVLVGVLLAGRALSLGRLALTVTAGQVLFHVLFVVGAATTTPHAMPTGHTGHAQPVLPAAVAETVQAGHAHGDLAMVTAHLAAALMTIALLHRGERALERLRAWADARLARWADLLTGSAAVAHQDPTGVGERDLGPLAHGFHPGVCPAAAPRRGPPSGAPRTPTTAPFARPRAPPDES